MYRIRFFFRSCFVLGILLVVCLFSVRRVDAAVPDACFELSVSGATGWCQRDVRAGDLFLPVGTAFTIVEDTGSGWVVRTTDGEGVMSAKDVDKCMINLPDVLPSVVYNIVNADSSIYVSSGVPVPNVTGEKLYSAGRLPNDRFGGREMFLVPMNYPCAVKLAAAQRDALEAGYSILVYDTYRTYRAQRLVVENLRSLAARGGSNYSKRVHDGIYAVSEDGRGRWALNWFIATGKSNHQAGTAIDMSLCKVLSWDEVTVDGVVVRIPSVWSTSDVSTPSAMHDLSANGTTFTNPGGRTFTKSVKSTTAFKMQEIMSDAGFASLASEWWHFDGRPKTEVLRNRSCSHTGDFEVTDCFSTVPSRAGLDGGRGHSGSGSDAGCGGTRADFDDAGGFGGVAFSG